MDLLLVLLLLVLLFGTGGFLVTPWLFYVVIFLVIMGVANQSRF